MVQAKRPIREIINIVVLANENADLATRLLKEKNVDRGLIQSAIRELNQVKNKLLQVTELLKAYT